MSSPPGVRGLGGRIFANSGLKIGKALASDFLVIQRNLREKDRNFFSTARNAGDMSVRKVLMGHFHLDNSVDS